MKKYPRNERSMKSGAGAAAAAAAGAQGYAAASMTQFWAWLRPIGQLFGRNWEWKKWWR